MKKLILLPLLAVLFVLGSCDDASYLAKNIEGTWSGAPARVPVRSDFDITATDTYNFTRDQGTKGGNVIITSMLSAQVPMAQSDSAMAGYNISAAATATISGTWDIIDDDEIEMILDPRSLTVNVDPKALEMRADAITGQQSPAIDSIAPALSASISHSISGAMSEYYLLQRHLEDVEIKNGIMRFECEQTDGGKDMRFTLRRQGDLTASAN